LIFYCFTIKNVAVKQEVAMVESSHGAAVAAGRARWAVWLALGLAVVAPLLVWLDAGLIALAVVPQVVPPGVAHAVTPRAVGVAATLVPAAAMAWGLLGLLPMLGRLRAGAAITPATGRAVARLGGAVALAGAWEPLGRAVIGAVLVPGELRIALGVSASAVLLVALGATLVALGHVLRDAAAAVAENQGFV
jgi:hypothetical protein